jgi:formate-dependent phosphoribosylglycinamide formyltransferase (GAR transformylase)
MEKILGLIAGTSGDSLTYQFQKRGYKVALVCGKKGEPGYDSADFKLVCDLSDSSSILDFFSKLGIKTAIFGTGHYKAIELLPLLKKASIKTNLEESTFNLVKDKIKFKELLVKHKILTPQFFVFRSIDEFHDNQKIISFPCVVKSSTDLIQPAKVFDKDRLKELVSMILEKGSDVLVEEYIDGSDCTVAVSNDGVIIKDYGVIYYCKAKEYRLEGFDGANANQLSSTIEKLVCELSNELVRIVGIGGLVRVDYMVRSSEIYVLEINAIMVTGYTGSAYPFFEGKGINISDIMSDVSLKNSARFFI